MKKEKIKEKTIKELGKELDKTERDIAELNIKIRNAHFKKQALLRELKKVQGLSYRELGEKVGLTRQRIHQMFNY